MESLFRNTDSTSITTMYAESAPTYFLTTRHLTHIGSFGCDQWEFTILSKNAAYSGK